jgi:oligopeptide/dipeptide ABC transporter, ATP-binding protein, C-terminal domain
MNEDNVLEVKNLEVRFYTYAGEVQAVSNVSFNVKENEFYALVGETGCGKTVTTRAITRLINPPGKILGGEVLFKRKDGKIIDLLKISEKELREIRGNEISYVFQDPTSALDPLYNVKSHFEETVLAHYEANKKSIEKEAINILKKVLIPSPEMRYKSFPHELSGGMRQRVVISLALINNPKLLIADEPTTNLDVTVQAQILDIFKQIMDERKMSIILITHNLGIVAEYVDRLSVMYAGKIVETGKTEQIFNNPLHPYLQMLLKSIPNPLKKIEKLEPIPGFVPSLINPPKGCRFHPRCPFAMSICKEKEPQLIEIEKDHYVACWLYEKK